MEKMYSLVIEFLDIIRKNNKSNIRHVLSTDGLYTSENLLEIKDFNFVGAIRIWMWCVVFLTIFGRD